jgi:hypothetical protein
VENWTELGRMEVLAKKEHVLFAEREGVDSWVEERRAEREGFHWSQTYRVA